MRGLVKGLEQGLKRVLALVAIVLLFRPGRRARAALALARRRRVLVVRIDHRVGEALLTTPVLAALAALSPRPRVDALVHPGVVRVLAGRDDLEAVIPFRREALWWLGLGPQMRALRSSDYDVVVDCGNWEVPSVTHAVLSRLAGPRAAVLGPAVWPVGALHTHPVPALAEVRREMRQRVHLLRPLGVPDTPPPLSHRPGPPADAVRAHLAAARAAPHAVVNPGGRLGWRRVPPQAFAAACEALLSAGRVPLVTWGPGEEPLAAEVAAAVPGAVLAPPTSLDDLAALMAAAGLTVCNNTGPMHLSVAVGAPTLQLFAHMDAERWGHPEAPHRVLDVTGLMSDPDALGARVREATTEFVAARDA